MRSAVLVPLLAVTLAACNYNHVKSSEGAGDALVTQEKLENPDYATVKAAVLGPKCVGCHSVAGGNQGSTNLESYPAVRALWMRVAYRSLESRDMPKDKPLSPMQSELLKRWIDSGLPERVIGGTEKPGQDIGRGPTNFTKIKNKIFKDKCLDCHQGANPDAGLDLSDIKIVRARILSILDSVIGRGDMPVAPYPAVTPRERDILLKWYNLGMPQ